MHYLVFASQILPIVLSFLTPSKFLGPYRVMGITILLGAFVNAYHTTLSYSSMPYQSGMHTVRARSTTRVLASTIQQLVAIHSIHTLLYVALDSFVNRIREVELISTYRIPQEQYWLVWILCIVATRSRVWILQSTSQHIMYESSMHSTTTAVVVCRLCILQAYPYYVWILQYELVAYA